MRESNIFFYENAWAVRHQLLSDFIDKGESNPLRLINSLTKIERHHILEIDTAGNHLYTPRTKVQLPCENVVTSEDRLNLDLKDCSTFPTGLNFVTHIALYKQYSAIPNYHLKSEATLILDFIKDMEVDAIVELGCGYGRNLIELFYSGGPKVPYYAGEFTKSGQECIKLISSICNEFELIPFEHNHLKPDLSFLKKHKKILVFTAHTIEQVEYIPLKLMEDIATCAEEVICMHIEPFGYQMVDSVELSQVDKDHKSFFEKKGWNKNFFPVLVEAHQKNILDISYLGKNIFGGGAGCPSSVAVWKNKNWKN